MNDDVTNILENLNDEQQKAVTAPIGSLRILAGAGSGKTRVLVHRIAWIITAFQVSPYSILAVTFTNKAAGEMRQRIEKLLDVSVSEFWIGTFHSICHRMLRLHHERANLSSTFQVLDRDDQLRVIKRLMKSSNIDDNFLKPKQVANAINQYKELGKRFADIDATTNNPILAQILELYRQYELHCFDNSLVDFTEILLRTVELLRDDATIRQHYQQRFSHILVDEFQDTNLIQYAFIQLIYQKEADLFIVGDDDQSIYGFRGACVANILNMEQNFADLQTIKLEQNYRSTGNILSAANTIIAKNSERLGKNLWTDSGEGELIDIYQAINEYDEASFVLNKIKNYVDCGGLYSECAILYRSNAQSRIFEETFVAENLPYRIYGGLRFFDRAEIKDVIAYLRLAYNNSDDIAFDRVVNLPTRGVGMKTMENIRDFAIENQTSLWQSCKQLLANNAITGKAKQGLADFISSIEFLNSYYAENQPSLGKFAQVAIDTSALIVFYQQQKIDKKEDKIENISELVNACENFEQRLEDTDKNETLPLFLAQAMLDAGETQASEFSDSIQLMTLHSAKGLEFKHVFLVGVEEGLFPHSESAENNEQLEEERRLAYVGITRAEEKLYISYSEQRRLYGETRYQQASRFINELPQEILNYIRKKSNYNQRHAGYNGFNNKSINQTDNKSDDSSLKLGMNIVHPKFGEGVIIAIEGSGEHQRIQVNFNEHGLKHLITAFANIKVV